MTPAVNALDGAVDDRCGRVSDATLGASTMDGLTVGETVCRRLPPLASARGTLHPPDLIRGWRREPGRRSDASAVTIARNTCRKTLKTLIQRPSRLPRPDPGPDPGIRMRFRLWRLGRLAGNRIWRRISLKTLETDAEMAGPTPSLTRGSR